MKSDKYISVMIVPPNDTNTFNLKIGLKALYAVGIIFLILLGILVYFLLNYGHLQVRAKHAEYLEIENQRLVQENRKVTELATELSNLKNMEKQILQMATTRVSSDYTVSKTELDEIYKNEVEFSLSPHLSKFKDKSNGNSEEFSRLLSKQKTLMKAIPSINPVEKSWISQYYSDGHKGLDLAAAMYTPVKAAASGEVTFAGEKEDFGNFLIIDHGNGYQTKYGHNHRFTVSVGDNVKQGDVIAFVGNSGNSSAPHLHYEIWHHGKSIDPLPTINNEKN
jgi:murein DD-endopeptidase MepM/ murein hydrolase activator NlpD